MSYGAARVGLISSLAFLVLGAAAGCATILGFEDTTLAEDASTEDPGEEPSDGDPDAGDEPDADKAAGLSVTPLQIRLIRGGAPVPVAVSLVRGTAVKGEVTVRARDLPQGLSSQPVTIPADGSSATLSIVATGAAPSGSFDARIAVDGDPVPAVPIALSVADSAGVRDPGFGDQGLVADESMGKASTFYALAVAKEKEVIFAGGSRADAGWFLRRYSSKGVLDTTFKPDLPDKGELRAVVIDGEGRIVCVGKIPPAPVSASQLTVVRLSKDGARDPSFGDGGTYHVPTSEAPFGSEGRALALGDAGTVWVAGRRTEAGVEKFSGVLVHLGANGAPVPAFKGGKPLFVPEHEFVGVASVGGRVVAAGTKGSGSGGSFSLTRWMPNGDADTTFATAGEVAFGNGYSANAFALAPDGSFVLGGSNGDKTRYAAGRVPASGGAPWARNVAQGTSTGYLGTAVQADGRIILVGASTSANQQGRVDRLLSDGPLDGAFGKGGTTYVETSGSVTLHAASITPDGRILVAGNRANFGPVIYGLVP